MTAPISVQLYSLREMAEEKGIGAVLEAVADIGYSCVEPAGFFEFDAAGFRARTEELGMTVSGSHRPWCRSTDVSEAVETAEALGLNLVAGGYGPDKFETPDVVKQTCDELNAICDALEPHGLKLFIHNHAWEFERFDGELIYETVAQSCPKLLFEIDTYWAANFGAEDPAEMVKAYGSRAPFLHIKDGSLVKGQPNVAVGQGKLDISAIIGAADPAILRALIVELDSCATDMLTAVRESYEYLVGNGLAAGRKAVATAS